MDALSLPLFDDPEPPAAPPEEAAVERAPLRPLYYLHNFRVAMESLRDRYADLLSPEESGFIRTFLGLPEAPQCLFTRLAATPAAAFLSWRALLAGSVLAPADELEWRGVRRAQTSIRAPALERITVIGQQ